MIQYAFRLVHIDNIPHILQNGIVHKNSPKANKNYIAIGDTSIIKTRENKPFWNGKVIGDFIPFYFGNKSPMLYVIQNGFNGVRQYPPEDIVYCVLKIEDIVSHQLKCCFTDGHALNALTKIYDGVQLNKLDELVSHKDVYAPYWIDENDRDLKRRKEAELLMEDEIPPQLISGFAVFNEIAKNKLLTWGVGVNKIAIKPNYYF